MSTKMDSERVNAFSGTITPGHPGQMVVKPVVFVRQFVGNTAEEIPSIFSLI